ncbi:serum response factor-binding protein 1 [Amblyraja radiata]|uniref:serum response factor-binding protein 1 n=1 Tax=Amblyraja radiata TaxID=386614 RepID=UPI0014036A47|nr:serum response factor-binding protein 1 [Amblyraja radiata]
MAAAVAAVAGPMNVNNEIVKLRKDVKKARILIIRKLSRNIADLKKKKGTQDAVMKNLRRAERLLEDIHTMKDLKPDDITKTALQSDLNCEKVCEKPNSTTEERAIARIASHPLVCKKITAIKAAVNSFQEARGKNKKKAQRSQQEPQLKAESLQLSTSDEISHGKTTKVEDDDTVGEKSKSMHITQTSSSLDKSEPEPLNEKSFKNEDTSEVQIEESVLISQVIKKTEAIATDGKQTIAVLDKSEPEPKNEKCFSDEDTEVQATESALVSQVTEMTTSTATQVKQTIAAPDKSEPEPLNEKCFSNKDNSEVQAAESALVSQVIGKTKDKATQVKQTSTTQDKSEPETLNEKCFSHEDTSKIQAEEISLVSQVIENTKPAQLDTKKQVQVVIKSQNISPMEEDASAEEKEYFDDSTEERFYNQTSSDESGDDDFFIGKVKRTNKKKQEIDPTSDVITVKDDEQKMPSSMEERKNKPIEKRNSREQTKFGTVFCNNLSRSKASMQRNNQGGIKNKKQDSLQNKSNTKILSFHRRSQGRPGNVIPKPQQSLHPSWEASRRRKEQNKIPAFQGKKMRFDD